MLELDSGWGKEFSRELEGDNPLTFKLGPFESAVAQTVHGYGMCYRSLLYECWLAANLAQHDSWTLL